VLAVGSPGADRITTAMHQFFVNFVQHGCDLEAAVAHPRLHLELPASGMRVAVEPGMQPPDCPWPVTQYPRISMYFGGVGAALFDRAGGLFSCCRPATGRRNLRFRLMLVKSLSATLPQNPRRLP
jgi:gamma-glutamyltranspeptidase / glutathione hydrolase